MSMSRGVIDTYDTGDPEVGMIVLYQYTARRGAWSVFWLCRITSDEEINLGHFETLPEARAAYNDHVEVVSA